jgi:bifunctional DNA primase/polymerase-like protein
VNDPVTLAVHYTDRGVPAFPVALRWNEEKHTIDKRPLLGKRGFRNAGRNAGQVRKLFREVHCVNASVGDGNELGATEELGVGVWLGPADILALDVDVKNDAMGDLQLAGLENKHGELPDTVRVTTGSGGAHIWLRRPPGRKIGSGQLAKDIDVRCDAGFVVAPGTTTTWGAWTFNGPSFLAPQCAPVGDCPPWVLDRLAERARNNGAACDAEPAADIDTSTLPVPLRALLNEQPKPGTRSDRTYHFTCVAIEAGLDDPTILAALSHYPPAVDKGEITRLGRRAIAAARSAGVRPAVVDKPVADEPPLRIIPVRQTLATPPAEPEPLAAGLVNRGELVVLGAGRAWNKSLFVAQLGWKLAEGDRYFLRDFRIKRRCNVAIGQG